MPTSRAWVRIYKSTAAGPGDATTETVGSGLIDSTGYIAGLLATAIAMLNKLKSAYKDLIVFAVLTAA